MIDCKYCHTDIDGYIKPIEKNCHAYLYHLADGWKLHIKLRGDERECEINYCPMCGRKLKNN